MHLLSFLGTGNYQPVAYSLDGAAASPTPFAAVAIARLIGASGVTVLATAEAEGKHWAPLSAALAAEGISAELATIPGGSVPSEHWEIFAAVQAAARGHERVALDITHGFRTLPLIGFLTAAFLRATGEAPLDRLLYGAYEAKDEETGVAPVFDLSSFLALLDWTSAAEQFLQTGSSVRLAALLEDTHQTLWRQGTDGNREELPRHLKRLAKTLGSVTEGLLLLRRSNRAENLERLGEALAASRDEVARFAPPFATLLDRVLEGTAPLRSAPRDEIATERAQVEWLLAHGRIDAALTLCREWLVSLAAAWLRPDRDTPADKSSRDPYETFLNACGGNPHVTAERVDDDLRPALDEPRFAPLGTAWDTISTLRNDLNHAGYNENSKSEDTFARDAEAAIRAALALAGSER